MTKDFRFRSNGLLPSCDGAWKQQHHAGPAAWVRLDTKHGRGLWVLAALVFLLLLAGSVSWVNEGSMQPGTAKLVQVNASSCMAVALALLT
jgi:hypothetical protein